MRRRGKGQGSVYKRKGHTPWYIAYRDQHGKRCIECSHTENEKKAKEILGHRIAEVAMRRAGVINERSETLKQQGRKLVSVHLADYREMLNARQNSKLYIRRTCNYIEEICDLAGFRTIADIGPDGVNRVSADMLLEGFAARTVQARVVAITGFATWLYEHGKLASDPLLSVKRPSLKGKRKLERRMLLPEEWPLLRAATLAGGVRNGLEPFARATLYALAIQTGLRASEIASLTKANLHLSGKRPYVRVKASNTKNKDEARQHIQEDLAADLERMTARLMPAVRVFPIAAVCDLAEALRADAADARRRWLKDARTTAERERRRDSDFLAARNHQGEILDFHSLRFSCGAWLAIQGVHPKVIQKVMRHSTITLTFDTYGRLMPNAAENAVDALGALFAGTKTKTG